VRRITDLKSTKRLTKSGEVWLRDTLSRFIAWLEVAIVSVGRGQLVEFLSIYDAKPWRKHSFYR